MLKQLLKEMKHSDKPKFVSFGRLDESELPTSAFNVGDNVKLTLKGIQRMNKSRPETHAGNMYSQKIWKLFKSGSVGVVDRVFSSGGLNVDFEGSTFHIYPHMVEKVTGGLPEDEEEFGFSTEPQVDDNESTGFDDQGDAEFSNNDQNEMTADDSFDSVEDAIADEDSDEEFDSDSSFDTDEDNGFGTDKKFDFKSAAFDDTEEAPIEAEEEEADIRDVMKDLSSRQNEVTNQLAQFVVDRLKHNAKYNGKDVRITREKVSKELDHVQKIIRSKVTKMTKDMF